MTAPTPHEFRVRDAVLSALREMAAADPDRVGVEDYKRYRREHAPTLPSVTTIYRVFGSWTTILALSAIVTPTNPQRRRSSEPELLGALRRVAGALGVSVLSSHAYDGYRTSHPEMNLPSSSVIRKWLNSWEEAVERAGLESPRSSGVRRVPVTEVLEHLRRAIADAGPDLSTSDYEEWCKEREADGEEPPRMIHILQSYPTFEVALRAADVERSDDLHPHALWTADEARRIARNVEALTRRRINRSDYEMIRTRARRPMPTWATLERLLDPEPFAPPLRTAHAVR